MFEVNIQKANFDKQKKELSEFANQPATSTELGKFDTSGKLSDFLSGGFLGLIDHKVTGKELNDLVTELQACFAEINERDKKVIREFGQVFETFEALDKGYIQGIMIGVKSAEKASQEAKDAQKDIDDTIKALQRTVNKLYEFKKQINSYQHLPDIDELWVNVKQIDLGMEELKKGLASHANALAKNDREYKRLEESISETTNELEGNVSEIRDAIHGQEHFGEIDNIWESVNQMKAESEGIASRMESFISRQEDTESRVREVSEFADRLMSAEHIDDIDSGWEYAQKLGRDLNEFGKKAMEMEDAVGNHSNNIIELSSENRLLKRRIIIAYVVAGGAFALSAIQLILTLIGVV